MIFLTIVLSVPALATLWWAWAHWRLGRLRGGSRWQRGTGVFCGTILLTFSWMFADRLASWGVPPPPGLLALLMLWGIVFLPFVALPLMGISMSWEAVIRLRRAFSGPPEAPLPEEPRTPGPEADAALVDSLPSRRQMLEMALVASPMILTLGATAYSIPQKQRFRVRDLHVDVPDLPRPLEGLRIAHVSDVHVGKFTRGPVLRRIADETNRLQPDLILLTGDLIDTTVDDLPAALDMVDLMKPRDRIVGIEGNHDLFDGREPFVSGVRERGIPLLLDESHLLRVRGSPVQLLGISWSSRGNPIEPHVDAVAGLRDPDAFPILLAHHPHAFDRAAEHGLPLTLAGHTHGGQLMASPSVGAGPLLFKYVSGLYRDRGSSLVVSNGVGNWFPLRTNAPAEIVHLILHRV